jgi:ATP-dependent helicase/DNAse subunit B
VNKVNIYKLEIDNPHKEFFLLNKFLEEQITSDSTYENARKARKTIYVANSRNKIKRIKKFIKENGYGSSIPRLVSIKPLFDILYDLLPFQDRTEKRIISDYSSKIILRYILKNNKDSLFPSSGFSLSTETADFLLERIKKIKEYNLQINFDGGNISYRKDASHFDLTDKENRFNKNLLVSLAKIFTLYQDFLNDNKLLDVSDKEWWITDRISSKILREYNFYIEHFSILRGIEQCILKKIYERAKSVSLLDFSFSFPNPHFTTTGILEGKHNVETIETKKKNSETARKIFKYERKSHEVEGIAINISRAEENSKIIVSSPDIEQYEKIFERIFRRYHICLPTTAHKKLIEFPIIKTILSLFEIMNQNLKRKSVISFLFSPFIKILKEDKKNYIDNLTREALIVSGNDWKRLKGEKEETRAVLNFISEVNLLKQKKGAAFIEHYLFLLDSLFSIKDEEANEIEAYNRLIEFITFLIREPIKDTIAEFDMGDFERIFLSFSETTKLNVEQKSCEKIEFLDLEESASMSFDTIYLIGLAEGKLPQKPQHDPLFSEKLLEEMGFPTYDMLYTLSKFNLESVIKSAKNIYLSYYEKDEDGNEFIKSPFLQDIEEINYQKEEDNIQTMLDWQMGVGEIIHKGGDVETSTLNDKMKDRAQIIREGIKRINNKDRLGNIKALLSSNKDLKKYATKKIQKISKRLSANALETYARCPLQFFLNYIVRLGELEEPEEGADSLIIGKVIHKITSEFFKKKLNRKIVKKLTQDWDELKEMAEDVIIKMVPGRRDRILLKLQLISQYEKALLKQFLLKEVEENYEHKVMEVEWRFTSKEAHIIIDGKRVGLSGRIDRIDKVDNELIIYDYKTGSKDKLPSNNKIREGEYFQFPIYDYAVSNNLGDVAKTAYYVINSRDKVSIVEREKVPFKLLQSNITRVWREIKGLNFEPKPSSKCETQCPFIELCPEDI